MYDVAVQSALLSTYLRNGKYFTLLSIAAAAAAMHFPAAIAHAMKIKE